MQLDMLVGAMTALGIVDEMKGAGVGSVGGRIPAADFTTPGTWIEPEECRLISRALRRFTMEQIPSDLFSALQRRWNAVQDRFRGDVAARGQIVVSGLESFPYDDKALRGVLLHWGAFNAIAADNGGYRVKD